MDSIEESHRTSLIDKKFTTDLNCTKFINYYFLRLVAKGKKFEKIDFKYSIFDMSYLRNCKFISCDFTGCKFIGTNFTGATFSDCKFEYAIFERTLITSDILDTECPAYDNLKSFFARTLRVNFQQIGDAQAVNKAIRIELQAEEEHLYKIWHSKERYYNNKYDSKDRFLYLLKWLKFRFLDFIWGNGESIFKILRTVFFCIILFTFFEYYFPCQKECETTLMKTLENTYSVFFGIYKNEYHSIWYLSIISAIRFVIVGGLIAICIKRLGRR